MKHIFIVNPAAGKSDRTAEYREMIDAAFAPRGLRYELLVSNAPGECRTLARQAVQSGEEVRLYACGGDGTLNEVVNGAIGYDNAAVTHFPGGSGNDSIKIFDDPAAFTSIERLLDAEEARFDLIRCNGMYALNVLSVGLDARIGTDIARYKRLPFVTGKGAYILSTINNLFRGISQYYRVTLDDSETVEGRQTMICICNGRWYGGSFNPVPDAMPDDGLLDFVIVEKVSRFTVASLVGKYASGRGKEFPELIHMYRGKELKVKCDRMSMVNVDGERLDADSLSFALSAKKIRFIVPQGAEWKKAET